MRNIGVLLVLLYVAYSSLAQNIVTSDDYIPYSGDIVIKEQLLHADAGNGGESCFGILQTCRLFLMNIKFHIQEILCLHH